ncbi:Uu.00g140930.m01.CDS01 [Anthostomella pinea]|uniref:Uu.00g140930.m01.CDS01 n=1 Tax=Anthostomella pinea TaxID=933095 RepID=A0AAI8VQ75_9PEZI|nr:Uu.00g140930.m01.CDS01 [Anthostomella pinea]
MREELDQDLPRALRRTQRASRGGAASSIQSPSTAPKQRSSSIASTSRTPSKPKSKKRVRFSDPGPEIKGHHHNDTSASTGLTPMVRRSSLGHEPSSKRRRHSTPLRRANAHHDDDGEDELAGNGSSTTSARDRDSSTEVRFLSLAQVLDDRVKRRIRRNGLSEEMNTITETKRRRAREQEAELQRLRDELADKDDEIERLHNTTLIQDRDRIVELEQQIEALRSALRDRAAASAADDDAMEEAGNGQKRNSYDWTLAARDPFSDSYLDDDEGFGDTTMADLVCSTPSKGARNSASGSFPTPPCTSPAIPATPCSLRREATPMTPKSHVGVQASFPDPEEEALEAELGSLRLELGKLTAALESHAALKARLADKLSSASSTRPAVAESSSPSSDIEAHLDTVLQTLSDRTAALLSLNASLSALGFAGTDASEIVSSLAGAFRSARLELEYLTPGEVTLPLSSRGAEVLDLVLTRLRDLAHRAREDEATVDEYHALEQSLRQQLGARVDAMDGLNARVAEAQKQLSERDARIEEMEVGLDRLKGAAEGYRRDIGELEALVQRVEAEGQTTASHLTSDLQNAQAQLGDRDNAVADLEAKLASILQQTTDLQTQLAVLQGGKEAEFKALNKSHGTALALRDARVAELRREIDGVNEGLREAHESIRRLMVENKAVERRAEGEKVRAKEAVDEMRAELERVVRMGAAFLEASRKGEGAGEGGVGAGPAAVVVRRSSRRVSGDKTPGSVAAKSRKRRRYDSGLGFLDEDKDEGEVELV